MKRVEWNAPDDFAGEVAFYATLREAEQHLMRKGFVRALLGGWIAPGTQRRARLGVTDDGNAYFTHIDF